MFGEENGNQFQHSCLENPMDGGAWEDAVHGVTKSQTPLSGFTFTFTTYELGEIATSVSQKLWLRYTLIIFRTVQKKVRCFLCGRVQFGSVQSLSRV